MTLNELVKKVKFAATRRLLTLKYVIKGCDFENFKKQYDFNKIIGSGGFGIVYAGCKLSTYQPVAIKFFERRRVHEWGKLDNERVPLEICMLSKCSRVKGVIDMFEWFSISDGFLIIMERPTISIDLYGFIIENNYLNEPMARHLFIQILETIQDCMQICKVAHRDLKNENVLIDLINGQIKLIDFGAAVSLKSAKFHSFQGTRLYCPPEWFTHSIYLDYEAAVWSLGIILYSMLNGQLPFLNEKDICTKHLLGPLPKYVDYSSVEDLIQCCFAYKPFQRIKLEEIKNKTWCRAKTTCSWDSLLSDQLQQKETSLFTKILNNELHNEHKMSSLTEFSNYQQQYTAANGQSNSQLHESEAAIVAAKSSSVHYHANTCVLQQQKKLACRDQSFRSQSTRMVLAKQQSRARSSDSGNGHSLQSCSNSAVASPVFSSAKTKSF